MLATSEALENAQARLAPYVTNLLCEFGRGVVVRVGSAGLRVEMLEGSPTRESAAFRRSSPNIPHSNLTFGPLQAEQVCMPHLKHVKSILVSKSPPRKVEHSDL